MAATKPGRTRLSSWARTSARVAAVRAEAAPRSSASQGAAHLGGEGEHRLDRLDDDEHPGGRVGAHGGERGGIRLLGAHLPRHVLGDDVVDGGVEAVLQQGGHRAVRVVGQRELLGVGEPGEHPLPRRASC